MEVTSYAGRFAGTALSYLHPTWPTTIETPALGVEQLPDRKHKHFGAIAHTLTQLAGPRLAACAQQCKNGAASMHASHRQSEHF